MDDNNSKRVLVLTAVAFALAGLAIIGKVAGIAWLAWVPLVLGLILMGRVWWISWEEERPAREIKRTYDHYYD